MKGRFDFYTPEDVATGIAGRVRAERLLRGWRQQTLAERSGVSVATIKRFEATGQTGLMQVLKIAHALGRLEDFESVLSASPAASLAELERAVARKHRRRGTL